MISGQINTGGQNQPAPSAHEKAQAPQIRTVNINMSGRSTGINVASQGDSDALVGLLRQLENGGGTAQ